MTERQREKARARNKEVVELVTEARKDRWGEALNCLREKVPGIDEETWIGYMIWYKGNDRRTITCGDVTLTGDFRFSPVEGGAPFVVIDYAERGKVIRNILRRRCKCYVVHWLLADDGYLYELLYDVEPYLIETQDSSYTAHPRIIYRTNGYPLVDAVTLPVEDRQENILVADNLPDWLGDTEDA